MDIFPLVTKPDWGFNVEPEANVEEVKLGDGYVYREPIGLNYLKEKFNPVWSSLDPEEGRPVYQWLMSRLKLKPFLWNHPVSGEQYQVVCQSVSITDDTWGNVVLSATFEQDFNPQA